MSWVENFPVLQNIVLPIIDILLLALIIYKAYRILVQTRAIQLVRGAFFVMMVYVIAFVLNLRTLLWLMNLLAPSIFIALVIIFQPELRNIFSRIGQGRLFPLFGGVEHQVNLQAILDAADLLAESKRGSLIVLMRSVGLNNIEESGTRLDADISSQLLLSIFAHDTALHDGAVLINGDKVIAAGCFLPLSEQQDIRRSFGTRHRAALGLAEQSDAIILIVSEETGAISLAYDSNLYYDLSVSEIHNRLMGLLNLKPNDIDSNVDVFD